MTTRAVRFTGLSAFPLTPVTDDGIDAKAFTGLIRRLADARVDSITVLGSTGSYAYLNRSERRVAVELAVAAAGDVPVFAGIGAVRTRDVLAHAQDAQKAGAAAVMLAGCASEMPSTTTTTTTTVSTTSTDQGPAIDVYYDGFYGPVTHGYWGVDGSFYYQDSTGAVQKDYGYHFVHSPAVGSTKVHLTHG